jgi:hypothetical protein
MKTFLHNGPLGDIIYALPFIKFMSGTSGGLLYVGKREFRDFNQTPDLLYQIRTLVGSQFYIREVAPYHGDEHIDYDLDPFRWEAGRCPEKNLVQCYFDALHIPFTFDTSTDWLTAGIEKVEGRDIVISQTTRFHDTAFNFSVLQNYQQRCIFMGLLGEYQLFVSQTGLQDIVYLDATGRGDDIFLCFARIIYGSKLYIGNQSFLTALANAMQVNRVLKVFKAQPNCMFYADNFHTELTKELIERYLNGKAASSTPGSPDSR